MNIIWVELGDDALWIAFLLLRTSHLYNYLLYFILYLHLSLLFNVHIQLHVIINSVISKYSCDETFCFQKMDCGCKSCHSYRKKQKKKCLINNMYYRPL
jgi:hypothetical protein